MFSATATQSKSGSEKELRRRAAADFAAARGTAHLSLLNEAQAALSKQSDQAEARIRSLQGEIRKRRELRDDTLRRTLVRHLVASELPALPGIGAPLAAAIQAQVFHGELDDLRYAYTVDGVGPRKQATIDEWRVSQQQCLPSLLADDFPGKKTIVSQYEVSVEHLTAELDAAKAAQAERRALLRRVEAERQPLRVVTVADFERALLEPGSYPEALHRFQLGLFAPWESPPGWFVAALEAAQLPAGKAPATPAREPDIHVLETPSYLKSAPSAAAEDDLSQRIHLDD